MSKELSKGVIAYGETSARHTDYLYRLSIKGIVRNERGEVLVVKETGRDWWDLPGGGMDHGEDIKDAIAREMYEEVSMIGSFSYQIIAVDDPSYLSMHDFWQVRLVFEVMPHNMIFKPGVDADEVAFMLPEVFKHADNNAERHIYNYAQFDFEIERGSLYVGSPETVANKIAHAIKVLDVKRFDMVYGAGHTPASARLKMIELYATEVIPRVRELLQDDK